MALKNAFRASLNVAGVDYGSWDALTGGDFDTNEVKYTPFDEEQRVYVGQKTTNNVTLERDYVEAIDGPLLAKDLRGQSATGVILDRDANGNFQQNRPPYRGVVKTIIPPDYDSNDSSTVVKIQVVISCGKVIAVGT